MFYQVNSKKLYRDSRVKFYLKNNTIWVNIFHFKKQKGNGQSFKVLHPLNLHQAPGHCCRPTGRRGVNSTPQASAEIGTMHTAYSLYPSFIILRTSNAQIVFILISFSTSVILSDPNILSDRKALTFFKHVFAGSDGFF